MPEKLTGQFLSQVTEEMTRNRNVYGAALYVENGEKNNFLGRRFRQHQ